MEELEDALKKKDDDMKQMEERYKKYLEKAKSVSIFFKLLTKGNINFLKKPWTVIDLNNFPPGDSDPGSQAEPGFRS